MEACMFTVTILAHEEDGEYCPPIHWRCPGCKTQLSAYSTAKECHICHLKTDAPGIFKDVKKRIAHAKAPEKEPFQDF
jgi:hypothetical protein